MLIGKIQFTPGDREKPGQPFFRPRQELLPRDFLRIGYEDEPWHATLPVTRRTPKAGTCPLRLSRHKTPRAGTPVFLIDRREPELESILREWEQRLARAHAVQTREVSFTPRLPSPARGRRQPDLLVRSSLPQGKETRGARASMTRSVDDPFHCAGPSPVRLPPAFRGGSPLLSGRMRRGDGKGL